MNFDSATVVADFLSSNFVQFSAFIGSFEGLNGQDSDSRADDIVREIEALRDQGIVNDTPMHRVRSVKCKGCGLVVGYNETVSTDPCANCGRINQLFEGEHNEA